MLRRVIAVIAGLIAGGTFNMILVTVSQAIYPYPESVDSSDFAQVREYLETNPLPLGALMIVLVAHAGGSLVSALVCGLIVKKNWVLAAIGLGLWWTLGGVAAVFLIPAPIWFAIVDIALYVPAALLGMLVAAKIVGGAPKETPAE
jgi:hypothetical protein